MLSIFTKRQKSLPTRLLSFTLAIAMSFALFGISASAVSQAELDSLKQQQEQLSQQKADIQSQLDEVNGKVTSETEKLDLLTDQLDVTNSELENLSEQIAIYTNSIAEMENELNIKKQKEAELLEEYKTHIRAMEEGGSYSYIEILMGASSLEDLFSRIDCILEIMEYDNNLISDVRDAQAKVQSAKEDMENEMAAQETVFEEYQDKQADLVAQQDEVKAVLESLSADSEDYQNQIDSVNDLQSSLGAKISDMEDELAELERIKAEQAAAAAAAAEAANSSSSGGGSGGGSSGGGGGAWYGDSAGTASGQDIVNYAETFLGVSYVYGGTSPSGFDCSGLVYYCYRHFGYSVNRTAAGLAYSGREVSSSNLQPGDIILFTSSDGSYIGHTGIYIGNGQFIHAPHTGDVVKISSLSEAYYTNHYWGARRVVS